MKRILLAGLGLALAAVTGEASAQTSVGADVTTNTTWNLAGSPYILQQPIFVKNGATLTIAPGVIVRGQPRTAAVQPGVTTGTPGALIVTRDGRLVADGGAANTRIIMTTAAVDNDDDGIADDLDADGFADAYPGFDPASCPGVCTPDASPSFLDDTPTTAPLAPLDKAGNSNTNLWGGLVVLGNAPTNMSDFCFTGELGVCTIEGLTVPGFPTADAKYGGILPHDNSGVLRYLSVRHAGDEIGNSNELNGVTLGGVGDGTLVEYVEVYVNFDDGFEWFGGTVNGRYLHVAFVGDDLFDLDQGYTGTNQFLFGIMPFFNENGGGSFGSASGDKAGEWDGDDQAEPSANVLVQSDGTCRPWSNPAMYNLTVLGSSPDADGPMEFTPTSLASDNRGIEFRHGFAGELLNSLVLNTGTALAFDIDSGSNEACGGTGNFDVVDNIATCTAQVLATTLDESGALAADENAALACGNADFRTPTAASDNVVNNAGFPGLVKEDQSFDPTGDAAGKLAASLKASPIDPRPNSGLTGTGGAVAGPKPLVSAASYRGAFLRTAPTLWTTGWTALNLGGLLAN